MEEVIMLLGDRPRRILQCLRESGTPITLSHCAERLWHRSRTVIDNISDGHFDIRLTPFRQNCPLYIEPRQLVGISFQQEYGSGKDRFIFGSSVLAESGGTSQMIRLTMPEEIELVRNKSFIRADAPSESPIVVNLRHRSYSGDALVSQAYHGTLLNISAEGLTIAVDATLQSNIRKGYCLGVTFVPADRETPLSFSAYVRHVLPTQSAEQLCLDMEIVGLEASPEGRMVLRRLCCIVTMYRNLAQQQSVSLIHQAITAMT